MYPTLLRRKCVLLLSFVLTISLTTVVPALGAAKPKAKKASGAVIAARKANVKAALAERATKATPGVRYDQPAEALQFFLEQRVPEGESYNPQRIIDAIDETSNMQLFDSGRNQFVPRSATGSTTSSTTAIGVPSAGVSATGALTSSWQPLGPGNIGGRTRALLIHPDNPQVMWIAGVAGGIWKSTNGGTSWTPKADLLVNIAVNSLVLDPFNSSVLYAGTGEGFFNGDGVRGAGVFKSTDGGETWFQLPSTTGADFFFVNKLIVTKDKRASKAGTGPQRSLYAATRTGVWRSADSGNTWARVLNPVINGLAVFGGCFDLESEGTGKDRFVYASCGTVNVGPPFSPQGGIFRASEEAAPTAWELVFTHPNLARADIAIAPSDRKIVYILAAANTTQTRAGIAGTYQDGLLGVFRSTQSGNTGTWEPRVLNTDANKLNTFLLSNPVIALLEDCFGDPGSSFFLNQGWYDNILVVDPVDPNVVWSGGIDIFRSDDGGATWGQASWWWFDKTDPQYAHADNHFIVFHPNFDGALNQTMFLSSDGGIFRTDNVRAGVSKTLAEFCGNVTAAGKVTWSSLNNGYEVTQFYHGTPFPSGAAFMGGTQDNGTLRGSLASGTTWLEEFGGDGGYVAINPGNTNIRFLETTGLSLRRTTDGGVIYSPFTRGIGEAAGNFLFINPFAMDPGNPGRMWTGGAFPWRTNLAATVPAPGPPTPLWTLAGQFFRTRISAWGIAPSNPDKVYAGTQTGILLHTNNATTANSSTVWVGTPPPTLPPGGSQFRPRNGFVSWVAVHPTNPDIAYATYSTFNTATDVGHVFRTTNGGLAWTRIDGSGANALPDVPVHSIAIDPADTTRLYVGTDIGVFVSLDGGASWARENTGFANVITEVLQIQNEGGSRYLYAFTHGRSVFRVALQ